MARTADLVLIMLDALKGDKQKHLLEAELEAVAIRLNKQKPNIYFKVKKGGGITFNATTKLTILNERIVYQILHDYKIFNADVMIREDCTVDDFIDVVLGNRKYLQCIYCYNKIDQISLEEVDELARRPNTVVISCGLNLNLDYLLDEIWRQLGLIRVYTKKQGHFPDLDDAVIVRKGATIEAVVRLSLFSLTR